MNLIVLCRNHCKYYITGKLETTILTKLIHRKNKKIEIDLTMKETLEYYSFYDERIEMFIIFNCDYLIQFA